MGAADVSSEKLRLNLEAEAQGEGAARGIHPSMPGAQTFQIFLPPAMLKQYSKIYFGKVQQALTAQLPDEAIEAALAPGRALPESMDITPLEKKQKLMNKIMKKYIEKVSSDPAAWVREAKDRPASEKLLGLHPDSGGLSSLFCPSDKDDGNIKDYPVMFPDPGLPSYSKALLYGLDFDFLMLECLVIACMDRCNYLPNGI